MSQNLGLQRHIVIVFEVFRLSITEVDSAGRREGKKGGKPSKPSKFAPGNIKHSGLISDDLGHIPPMWFNEMDPNARDPNTMAYQHLRFENQFRMIKSLFRSQTEKKNMFLIIFYTTFFFILLKTYSLNHNDYKTKLH
jgi:hypothetical protein